MNQYLNCPEFDDLDAAADYVKFNCRTAPVCCAINGEIWNVWGDGYAERVADTRAEIERLRARVADGFDLIAHLTRQREFSERTFGPGARTKGVIDHIRKELIEIEAKPDDLSEWVDVILLALDGAWRAGYTPQQICEGMTAKQVKNEARTWPDWRTADPNKAIEHDRSKDGA